MQLGENGQLESLDPLSLMETILGLPCNRLILLGLVIVFCEGSLSASIP